MVLRGRTTASQSTLTDNVRLGRIGGQMVSLGEKSGRQAPLDRQPIAAVRLAPVESAAIQFRQAQHAVQNGVQQRLPIRPPGQNPGKFVLRLQQQLGVLAPGDVEHRAGGQQRLTRLIPPHHPAPCVKPKPSAIRCAQAIFGFVLRTLRRQRRRDARLHERQVVGMNQIEPGRQAGWNLFEVVAQQVTQVGIPKAAFGDVVVLPDANAGGVQHQIQLGLQRYRFPPGRFPRINRVGIIGIDQGVHADAPHVYSSASRKEPAFFSFFKKRDNIRSPVRTVEPPSRTTAPPFLGSRIRGNDEKRKSCFCNYGLIQLIAA